MNTDPIKQVEDLTRGANDFMKRSGKSVLGRYPLVFSFLGTFGVVLIINGFEGVIDKISVLRERPILILIVGILLLTLTGTLYKRIEKRLD
ncbi:MAG: hypothetical protein AAB938_00805 [Patescibacteria group bacterium]